jgi:hypothetical protein
MWIPRRTHLQAGGISINLWTRRSHRLKRPAEPADGKIVELDRGLRPRTLHIFDAEHRYTIRQRARIIVGEVELAIDPDVLLPSGAARSYSNSARLCSGSTVERERAIASGEAGPMASGARTSGLQAHKVPARMRTYNQPLLFNGEFSMTPFNRGDRVGSRSYSVLSMKVLRPGRLQFISAIYGLHCMIAPMKRVNQPYPIFRHSMRSLWILINLSGPLLSYSSLEWAQVV